MPPSISRRKFFNAITPPRARRPSFSSYPLDHRSGAHAAADTQRHQSGVEVAPLELVDHRPQDHRAGGTERMAEGDGAAVDVDLLRVELEGLHVAEHDRGERLVDL